MTSISILKVRTRRVFRKKGICSKGNGRGEGDQVMGLIFQMHVGQPTHAFFSTASQMKLSSRTLIFGFLLLQTFITTCHISATFQKSVAEP